MSWIPEADSKIFLLNKAVSKSNFKKLLLKQPFFCRSFFELADAKFQLKQNKECKIYSKQTKCQF